MQLQNDDSIRVWEIQFKRVLSEEEEWLLLGYGAQGVEKRGAAYFALFCSKEHESILFQNLCESLGLEVLSRNSIANRNWVQCCSELWSPIKIGNITVMPVLNGAQKITPAETGLTIKLMPGTGFGTGHHESTRLAITLMQHQAIGAQTITRILDLGTGSGILSIAAAALFTHPIDAIDTDSLALENARSNFAINGLTERISIFEGSIDKGSGRYELILANIYAEILVELAPFLANRITEKGRLILSGITADKRDFLLQHFTSWQVLQELQEGNWIAFLMTHKQTS